MNLYVVRHGETYANADGVYNGRIDDDLNKLGIAQAKELIDEIKKVNIDLIICSPMKRTKQTCKIINVNNIKAIYDERIIERDPGILGGRKLSECNREEFWNYYSRENIEGLETVKELFDRVFKFLEEIKTKYNNKNILLVTHSGVARAIYFYFNEITNDGYLRNVFNQKNGEIKMYRFDENSNK